MPILAGCRCYSKPELSRHLIWLNVTDDVGVDLPKSGHPPARRNNPFLDSYQYEPLELKDLEEALHTIIEDDLRSSVACKRPNVKPRCLWF